MKLQTILYDWSQRKLLLDARAKAKCTYRIFSAHFSEQMFLVSQLANHKK